VVTVAKIASAFLMRCPSVECLSQQRRRFLLVAAGTRFHCKIVRFRRVNGRDGNHGIGIAAASNHLLKMRDITELGHCNFQFDGNAAGASFQPGGVVGLPPVASEFCEAPALVPLSLLAPGSLSPR
jgi:hypothetical protein